MCLFTRRKVDGIHISFRCSASGCPPETSYPECRDTIADFSFVLADGDNADEVLEQFEQSLSESISSGDLQKTLDEVNSDSPVTILGLQEGQDETTMPNGPTEVETTASFRIGLTAVDLEGEDFLRDITAAVDQLAAEVLDGVDLARRELSLTVATGGT